MSWISQLLLLLLSRESCAKSATIAPLSQQRPPQNPMNLNIFCYLLLALAAVASALLPHPLVMWLLLASVLTFVIYDGDKMAARKGWRRVPESTLLVLGLVGGWPGAVVGQQLFRHKTQKQPFKTYFFITIVLNIGVMVALYWCYPNVISLVM